MKLPLSLAFTGFWIFLSFFLVATAAEDTTTTTTPNYFRYDPVFASEGLAEVCDYYLAPSELGGWGVYAGRDFDQGEPVEIVPRYIALHSEFMQSNVLDDYFYGFRFKLDPDNNDFGVVSLGMAMFFNHGPGDKHNVQYTDFGREPDKHTPWAAMLLSYAAKRDIKRGEELLSSYGLTEQWFTDRGLTMAVETEKDSPDERMMKEREKKYCSKLVSGIGQSTWHHRVVPAAMQDGSHIPDMDVDKKLPIQDHPTAVAKEFVTQGDVLEMSPALVVPVEHMITSPFSPMVIYWDDLDSEQQQVIKDLREFGAYRMKGKDSETGRMTMDILQYYEDACILPAAGNLAMVKKVGNDHPNCKMEILASVQQLDELDLGSTGLVLKLTALKDIQPGEELRLNLPDNSSWDTKMSLQQHLALLGQPIPSHIVDTYNPAVAGLTEEQVDLEPEF